LPGFRSRMWCVLLGMHFLIPTDARIRIRRFLFQIRSLFCCCAVSQSWSWAGMAVRRPAFCAGGGKGSFRWTGVRLSNRIRAYAWRGIPRSGPVFCGSGNGFLPVFGKFPRFVFIQIEGGFLAVLLFRVSSLGDVMAVRPTTVRSAGNPAGSAMTVRSPRTRAGKCSAFSDSDT
jgi:hypothetical protein